MQTYGAQYGRRYPSEVRRDTPDPLRDAFHHVELALEVAKHKRDLLGERYRLLQDAGCSLDALRAHEERHPDLGESQVRETSADAQRAAPASDDAACDGPAFASDAPRAVEIPSV